jgi:hypothetical protein
MKKPRFAIKVPSHVVDAVNYEMPAREYLTRLFPNSRFAEMFLDILIEGDVIDSKTLKCKKGFKSDHSGILRYLRKFLGEKKYTYLDMVEIGRTAFGMETTDTSIRTAKSKSDILNKLEGL